MAEGFDLTTYYAKRIIGDTAAASATSALLQTGTDITGDTWILHRDNRTSKLYGIKYAYDGTNGHDKIEYYGKTSSDSATAWIQLDTGDITANKFIGPLQGNADTATKATQDSDGNAINTTYIKKSVLAAKGDIIYASGASSPTALTIGTAGYFLKATADGPVWANTNTITTLGTITTGTWQATTLAIGYGGTGNTTFTDSCVVVPSTANSVQKFGSVGLKVTGATNANITLSPYTAGKTMTISSTTGAMTLSSTTAKLTISTTTGAMDIGPTGSGALSITTGSGAISVISGNTVSIASASSQTTTINSGSTLYLQRTSNASVVFCGGGTATANYHGRFNPSGNLQLETGANVAGTQNTHKLYVKGDSAFEGKIAFGIAASNAITNKAYMEWNGTDLSIDFIFV